MTSITMRATAMALCASGLFLSAGAARAESMKACSLKYQAAKKNGTLNGEDWKSFRAAQCGSDAPAAATDTGSPGAGKSATAISSPVAAATPAGPNPAAAAPTSTATAGSSDPLSGPGKSANATTPAASGNVVFPSAVSPKYASLTAGKGRMKTCVDQYKANKADGGNGGLKWIQKGGGYYSECSKKLKGA